MHSHLKKFNNFFGDAQAAKEEKEAKDAAAKAEKEAAAASTTTDKNVPI